MSNDSNSDTDSDIEEELAELREQDRHGTRADPGTQSGFVDALEQALNAVDDGEASDTISAYDPTLAAVLDAMESDGQLEDTFEQLQDAYEGNSGLSQPSKSAIIRLAVRVGLQEGTDDVMDNLAEAMNRHSEPTI